MDMITQMRGRIHVALVALTSILFTAAAMPTYQNQEPMIPESVAKRQVLVQLRHSALNGDLSESELEISDSRLLRAFSSAIEAWGIDRVDLAFPNTSPADTLQILSDGREYRRM